MKLKQLVDGTWSVRRSEAVDSEIIISTAGSSPGLLSKSQPDALRVTELSMGWRFPGGLIRIRIRPHDKNATGRKQLKLKEFAWIQREI
jgi:hypothetical protein